MLEYPGRGDATCLASVAAAPPWAASALAAFGARAGNAWASRVAAISSYNLGLATKERYEKMLTKKKLVEEEITRLKKTLVTPKKEINGKLEKLGLTPLKTAMSLYDLIKRPELNYFILEEFIRKNDLDREIKLQVETQIKYEGYLFCHDTHHFL